MRSFQFLVAAAIASLAAARQIKPHALQLARGKQPLAAGRSAALAPFEDASASLRGGGSAVDAKAAAEMRGAVIRTLLTVTAATLFGVGVAATRGRQSAMEFFAGYLVEQSLSVDNLFVFILLFEYFKVPAALQQRALKWGIIGAVAMRGVMIAVGVELVNRFRSVTLVFAGILLASSYKLLVEDDHADEEMGENAVVRLGRKLCGGVDYFDGDKFFTMVNGAKVATPLLLCVVCIELSDFVFAVDSIPAVLAISKDPFIVYSSNIFAIAALRSLYQVLAAAIAELPYLRPAVALILGFVGVKMLAEYFHVHIPTATSLAIICATLGGGVALSLLDKRRQDGGR